MLRGVVLEGYEGAGDRFVIESKQISNGDGVRLALTLADTQGRPRYSAQATLARRAASATSAPQTPSGLARFDRVVYDGVALFHGTADPFVPYAGGHINIGIRDRDAVLSAESSIAIFAKRNGCGAPVTRQKGDTAIRSYSGCAAPTVLYSIEGGGHGWPGGLKALPGKRAGQMTTDISAPDEIWAFFSRF